MSQTNSVTRRLATLLALCLLAYATTTIEAFAGIRVVVSGPSQRLWQQPLQKRDALILLYSSNDKDSSTAAAAASSPSAFVPLDNSDGGGGGDTASIDTDNDDDDLLEKVELLGKGAAKVCMRARVALGMRNKNPLFWKLYYLQTARMLVLTFS
jgi:hypothetical protein